MLGSHRVCQSVDALNVGGNEALDVRGKRIVHPVTHGKVMEANELHGFVPQNVKICRGSAIDHEAGHG